MKVSERLQQNPRSRGYNRRKGHTFEREVAQELRSVFPKARRQLEYHSADANGVDIAETGHFRIQCKHTKRYVSINTIEEIKCERDLGEIPILLAKAEGKEVMAVLPWWFLLGLIEAVEKKK